MSSDCVAGSSQRFARRRSRYGCRNCKIRKLKCDERKPQCKSCRSFGLICTFVSNTPEMQHCSTHSENVLVTSAGSKPQTPFNDAIWTSDGSAYYHLDKKCQNFISRYLGQSLITPEDSKMKEVNTRLLELAFTEVLRFNLQHPFLMHASLAVAFAYDRHLNKSPSCGRGLEESYHTFQGTVLFNKRLREPICAKDKDAIWGTAAALALLAFSNPEQNTPLESWPLNSSKSCELDWLLLSNGKMSLWTIANPLRPDSIFRIMAPTYATMHASAPKQGVDGIPTKLISLCCLNGYSRAENNPYFRAAYAVSQIQELPDNEVNVGHTERFIRCLHGPFRSLLEKKDPVALLLFYLWYRKACAIWWIHLRAKVEAPSIREYLRLYHGELDEIQAFL